MYITIDGCDACGKDSQLHTIREAVIESGIKEENIMYLREPGGSINAERIRDFLLSNDNLENPQKETELLLMMASRVEAHKSAIMPFIKACEDEGLNPTQWAVISNRSHISSYAYQGCENEETMRIYDALMAGSSVIKQDIPIILHACPVELKNRLAEMNLDRIEKENMGRIGWLNINFIDWADAHVDSAEYPYGVVKVRSQDTVGKTTGLLKDKLKQSIDNYMTNYQSQNNV